MQATALDDADTSAYLHYLEQDGLAGAGAPDGVVDILTAVKRRGGMSGAEAVSGSSPGHEGHSDAGLHPFRPPVFCTLRVSFCQKTA